MALLVPDDLWLQIEPSHCRPSGRSLKADGHERRIARPWPGSCSCCAPASRARGARRTGCCGKTCWRRLGEWHAVPPAVDKTSMGRLYGDGWKLPDLCRASVIEPLDRNRADADRLALPARVHGVLRDNLGDKCIASFGPAPELLPFASSESSPCLTGLFSLPHHQPSLRPSPRPRTPACARPRCAIPSGAAAASGSDPAGSSQAARSGAARTGRVKSVRVPLRRQHYPALCAYK